MNNEVVLLNETGKLFSEDSKTNKYFYFNIQDDFEKLIIKYDYSPKHIDDKQISKKMVIDAIEKFMPEEREMLIKKWEGRNYAIKNLTTLTTFFEDEFVGCRHYQGESSVFYISKDESSKGYLRKEIKRGKWRVGINCHAVIGEVNYNLEVLGVKNV